MSTRNAALAACLACVALIAGACGDDEEASTTTAPATTTTEAEPAEPTATRRELERHLRAALRAQDATVRAGCVIRALRTTLSNRAVDAAVEAIRAGDEVPNRVTDAGFAAGRRCGTR